MHWGPLTPPFSLVGILVLGHMLLDPDVLIMDSDYTSQ